MKITMDNNCLISLKKKDGEYAEIKTLIGMHPDQIKIYIPAIAASENQQGHMYNADFAQFQEFLVQIGCERCELLNPMAYCGIFYCGYAVISGAEMESLERKIHYILFPNLPFDYSEYCSRFGIDPNSEIVNRKWRNAKCDVQAMWCHINYKNEIFVSQDNNYHKPSKKAKLVALGAGEILGPRECLLKLKRAATN